MTVELAQRRVKGFQRIPGVLSKLKHEAFRNCSEGSPWALRKRADKTPAKVRPASGAPSSQPMLVMGVARGGQSSSRVWATPFGLRPIASDRPRPSRSLPRAQHMPGAPLDPQHVRRLRVAQARRQGLPPPRRLHEERLPADV
eukprot:CAMPEP_0176210082 /NCGR_PEP_ID=MMETSP0121_2-20121125/13963_1 /TAXON_ID=160619 /ORGANISM="Kryptoperidinium foliaceum, Strain CCMP 1326" /LENGTH=142 /DNA_ID=CAMNT_0017549109 /DNA_START=187 /DNA_END=610 /DNA_ORIENTATION=-